MGEIRDHEWQKSMDRQAHRWQKNRQMDVVTPCQRKIILRVILCLYKCPQFLLSAYCSLFWAGTMAWRPAHAGLTTPCTIPVNSEQPNWKHSLSSHLILSQNDNDNEEKTAFFWRKASSAQGERVFKWKFPVLSISYQKLFIISILLVFKLVGLATWVLHSRCLDAPHRMSSITLMVFKMWIELLFGNTIPKQHMALWKKHLETT